jgi:hypothetical protein
MHHLTLRTAALGACLAAFGCESSPPIVPAVPVDVQIPPEKQAEIDALQIRLAALGDLTSDALIAERAPAVEPLGYAPLEAEQLDLIQGSALALTEPELEVLGEHGFVLRNDVAFATFQQGYTAIYAHDLPLYISADSILEAVHRSYDDILRDLEGGALAPALTNLLSSMRANLPGLEADPQVRADLDVYLSVALSLLTGERFGPVAGGDSDLITMLFERSIAADGAEAIVLFGKSRRIDFSQMEPRGHYAGDPALERYFRAMMWVGRIELRLVEPDEFTHEMLFNRRQFEGAIGMRLLMDDAARAEWARLDRAIGAFVGEHDSMTPTDVDTVLAELEIAALADLARYSDEELADHVFENAWGTQRVASQYMVNARMQGTLPLSQSFLLLGQRYTADAHVFTNVTYSRVQHGDEFRMMPSTLDVAYAALANNRAVALLKPELDAYHYAPDLEAVRLLVDEHEQGFWQDNLYNLWMSSLRSLSPNEFEPGLPTVMRTDAWGRRLLNTQLASWAELRHDTLLYAKQSYTDGSACEFPDAYVDPYPAFYAALEDYADLGLALSTELSMPAAQSHFEAVRRAATTLRGMAENELAGIPFTAEQMEFVNDTVTTEPGCGDPFPTGWYSQLHYQNPVFGYRALEIDPVVADVHTQPTDEGGNEVGRVLHAGTGLPRQMVVTVPTCMGPRAYVGLASRYHERITEDWERLTDEDWAALVTDGSLSDVPWTSDVSP